VLPSSRSVKGRPGHISASAWVVLVATLLTVAWGAFAFGSVYAWAYVPLALASAAIGVLGLATGTRPVLTGAGTVWFALAAIGVVGLFQLAPVPGNVLAVISPGTLDYLRRSDLSFNVGFNPVSSASPALSHTISIAPQSTVRALGLLLAPALLSAGLCRSLSRTAASKLAVGIVAIGSVLALVGITQKIVLGDHAFGGMRIYGFWRPESLLTTPFGPFVNKNHFAGWMLMATPLALGLSAAGIASAQSRLRGRGPRNFLVWCSEPEGGRSMLFLVAAIFMTLSLFMTGSRSGMTCLAVILVSLFFAARRLTSGRMMSVLGVLVALGTIALLQWAGSDAALQRFGNNPESFGMRLDIWSTALAALRLFPWFGSGLDSFGTMMLVYQPEPHGVRYVEAHNDYLQLLVEGGIVMFALIVVAIVGLVLCIRGRFNTRGDGPEGHWVRVGATIGLLAIGLQSFVEFSLQMPGNTALFAVLLALAVYLPAPLQPSR